MNNKSIIIIDTPENCDKCRICARAEFDDYCSYLGASNGEFIYPNGHAELAIGMSNCPLRPLPEPKYLTEEDEYDMYDSGWDDCLTNILGETDNE